MEESILHSDLIAVPCSIGDTVWGIKSFNGHNRRVIQGKVHEMYFGEDMSLCICVKGVCRGRWGERVFPGFEPAMKKLKELKEEDINGNSVRK